MTQKSYFPKPKITFLNKKEQRQLDTRQQYILNELYRFRDEQAKSFNRPAYQIIADSTLYKLLESPTVLNNWTYEKGVYYRLQTVQTAEALKAIYEQAEAQFDTSLQAKNATNSYGASHQLSKNKQIHLKNEVFLPIKKAIQNQFGVALSSFLLSNETINLLTNGTHRLKDLGPDFQQRIIREVASELNIDLADFT